jgi:hypothetical protein
MPKTRETQSEESTSTPTSNTMNEAADQQAQFTAPPHISGVSQQAPPTPQEETVTVSKQKLQELVDRLVRLESAADVGRLAKFDAQHRGEIKRVVRISTLGGRAIIGWGPLKEDEKIYNSQGRQVGEKQTRVLKFQDGEEIQEERKTSDGRLIFKVIRLDNGETLEIDSLFVN